MTKTGDTKLASGAPQWGLITLVLAIGIVFVGFGNADRIFWRMTSHGAKLPGLVTEVRSYYQPDATYATYVPKIAFRDPAGQVRIMETRRGSVHYDFAKDQPVMVLWRENSDTIAVDLPFQRKLGTSIVMWLFTTVGCVTWSWGIWLIMRRIVFKPVRMRQ